MTIKEGFNIRIERLHYKKVPDIKQGKAKAGLGFQQAATFVEGQSHTSNRLLEAR
jgi:ribosomal protein L7/L12